MTDAIDVDVLVDGYLIIGISLITKVGWT